MKKTNTMTNIIVACTILFLSACSNNAPVTHNQAGSLNKESAIIVKQATVTGIKNVTIQATSSRGGGTVGSIAGSILGSSVPVAGSLIGSLIGGAVGSEAGKQLSNQKGHELTLLTQDKEQVIVTQLANTEFKIGDPVSLVIENNSAKVTHLQE